MSLNYSLSQALARLTKGLKYEAANLAPATYLELQANVASSKCIKVWQGASEGTIWGAPEVNYAFRAWHDSLHIKHGLDFSLAGELAVAELTRPYFEVILADYVYAEVAGQVLHYSKFGAFPVKQAEFIASYIKHGLTKQF